MKNLYENHTRLSADNAVLGRPILDELEQAVLGELIAKYGYGAVQCAVSNIVLKGKFNHGTPPPARSINRS